MTYEQLTGRLHADQSPPEDLRCMEPSPHYMLQNHVPIQKYQIEAMSLQEILESLSIYYGNSNA